MGRDFPHDLLQAQRDWYTTYRLLADSQGTQTAVLRRRLQRLSVRISTHPHWATRPDAPAARMELKQLAWHAAESTTGTSTSTSTGTG
ncbi:hypothetical protein QMK19_01705 [Streptomyces sp. H10-C2]|uniref:hypothetical protein n=1 Tax=unclassified Streptomyces TaxID=2593676 RepID=UPI0024B878EC|nr:MULTISPECIES: hypothetical protein [unclassified Streptomyces]MDJ0342090.1 hypothetical protein [Streptomyces sp. PH10-H1]MDJ0368432.1 hypothetical protein [Streptomyces sp. H10-C2]